MAEMETLAATLPAGFMMEWTGTSLQERASVLQMPLLMALSVLTVFMVLAALYESWAIPPVGDAGGAAGALAGAVTAVYIAGMPNDVFFPRGAYHPDRPFHKNAILIVEFARQLHASGMSLHQATITAARLRLRPIVMTSLAFTLGVAPLMLATGASSQTQHAIGTGVFGGMISGTLLAIFFVPVFYVVVMRGVAAINRRRKRM